MIKRLGRPPKLTEPKKEVTICKNFNDSTLITRTVIVKTNLMIKLDLWENLLSMHGIIFKTTFKNSLTLVKESIKIYGNGSFHVTGVKDLTSVHNILLNLIELVQIPLDAIDVLIFKIIPVMTNMRYYLGYNISNKTFNNVIGYGSKNNNIIIYKKDKSPGITVKVERFLKDLNTIMINIYKVDVKTKTVTVESEPFINCYKKTTDKKYTTLLFYSSGIIMMSGLNEQILKKVFEDFKEFTRDIKGLFY